MAVTLASHRFRGPFEVGDGIVCDGPGIYAVLDDRSTVLYIGQSSQVDFRVGPSHHKWRCFLRHTSRLRVAYLCMSGDSEAARLGLEKILIKIYDPPCNG